jgi:dienelactone hydrolase
VFAYQRSEIPFKNRMLDEEETSLYRVRYVRFPSVGDNGQPDNLVRGKYYESKLPGRKPMVIVLPIWGRHVYPSEKMTAYLKRRSGGRVNVFLMEGEEHLIDWQALVGAADEAAYLDLWEQGAQREWVTITDIRRTIDWAETRADLDPERIGLVGFSHGAMVAGAVAAQEPRLAATALVMGGALAHQVLTRCPLTRSEPAKAKAAADFGWSLEDLERRLEPIFAPLDAASYPGRVDPSRVLIVEAARDQCMTQSSRKALWKAMSRPQRLLLDYRHKQAFLAMTPLGFNWLRRQIWDFLQQTLEPS